MLRPAGRRVHSAAVTAAYFRMTDAGFVPGPDAAGPWSPDMLHGRLLGGLAARALEAELGGPGWRAARLTVDLFRPAAMAPVQLQTRVVRQGRRIRVADALMTCDGHEVARAAVVLLATSSEPPGLIWRPEPRPWPDPLTVPRDPTAPDPEPAWMIRTVGAGFESAGQGRVWTNDRAELVAGEAMSPFVRAAVTGDLACPLANGSDEGLHYINGDYTLVLARYPAGPWIGVEVNQQLAADGISLGSSTLVDRDGPFGTSTGTSLARPPLVRDEPGA